MSNTSYIFISEMWVNLGNGSLYQSRLSFCPCNPKWWWISVSPISHAWGSTAIIKISFVRDSHLNIKPISFQLLQAWPVDILSVCVSQQALCAHMCGHALVHLCVYARLQWERMAYKQALHVLCADLCPQSVSQEAPQICRKGFWAAENWVQQHWYWPPKSKVEPSTGWDWLELACRVGIITHRVCLCSAQ